MIVFSDSIAGKLCEEFVFSIWPEMIFAGFEADYNNFQRSVRGPGQGLEIPPMLLIVLSRAPNRYAIPETIRDLREEYESARYELWTKLAEMWEAPTLKEQMDILNSLEGAVSAVMPSIASKKFDCMSVGLDLAKLNSGGVASAAQKALGADETNRRLPAVSFAKKISKDLRSSMGNNRKILARHFSPEEMRGLGY